MDAGELDPVRQLHVAPYVVAVGDGVVLVGEEREPEVVLLVERQLIVGRVGTDPDDDGVTDLVRDVA